MPRERDRAGAGVRRGELPEAGPAGDALHRRRAGFALGANRQGPLPRATTSASRASATRGLPEGSVDAVIGNPPFADVKLEHNGVRFSLHDYFFAKSLDALTPGRHPGPRDHALHARQAKRPRPRVPRRPGPISWGPFGCPRTPSPARGRGSSTDIVFLEETRGRRAREPRRRKLARSRAARHRGRGGPHQPLLSRPPRDGARALGAARTGSTGASRAIA